MTADQPRSLKKLSISLAACYFFRFIDQPRSLIKKLWVNLAA
jgi:hypothetical protein